MTRKKSKKNKSVVTQVSGRIFVTPKIAKGQAKRGKKMGIAPAGPIKRGIPNDGIIDYTHTIRERPFTKGQTFVKVDGYEVLLKTAKKPLTKKQIAKREERLAKVKARTPEQKEATKAKAVKRASRKRRAAKLAAMSKKDRDEYLAAEKSRKARARSKAKLIASGKTEAEATAIMAARAKKTEAGKKPKSARQELAEKLAKLPEAKQEALVERLAVQAYAAGKKTKTPAEEPKSKPKKTEAQKEAARQRRAAKKAAEVPAFVQTSPPQVVIPQELLISQPAMSVPASTEAELQALSLGAPTMGNKHRRSRMY
jgi:hypothetical protein